MSAFGAKWPQLLVFVLVLLPASGRSTANLHGWSEVSGS
jgi:hypothetical protein